MPAIRGGPVRWCLIAVGFAGALSLAAPAQSGLLPGVQLTQQNLVPGCVSPDRLMRFLRSRNARLDERFATIAENYAIYGQRLGVRWDVGFFQMMVETNNLSYRRSNGSPGDVAPEHNNFAGIGALGDGRPGEIFSSIGHGVRAHLEHVLHYSGATVRAPIAERTRKVQVWRVLASWHKGFERPITYTDLAMRWALQSEAYLKSIEQLAGIFQRRYCAGEPVIVLHEGRRNPQIARTAWRFEKLEGKPGSPGVTPPTGKPNLKSRRVALGRGRPRRQVVSSPPPLPSVAPRRRIALAAKSVARPRIQDKRIPARRPRISKSDRIRQMVSDRKIMLRTHVGAVIPIVYRGNGKMVGSAGSLGFFLGASQDSGRWWVKKGKLCQKWRVWLDREIHCMTLKERDGTIWWKSDDGKSGTARIVKK